MSQPRRWPLHPPPRGGEALSSWLYRVGVGYGLTLQELLQYDFGNEDIDRLDIDPAADLLERLSARSGVDVNALRFMSLAGHVPGLLDNVNPNAGGFDAYVRQFSVLALPGPRRPAPKPGPWRAWVSDQVTYRACPECLRDRSGDRYLKLTWRLPLMLTCVDHRCRLRLCHAAHGQFIMWSEKPHKRVSVAAAISSMDQRTNSALGGGHVKLLGREIDAAVWFRLLRTLIDELTVPLSSHRGSQSRAIKVIWDRSGHAVRAGKNYWCPFERLAWPFQNQVLEAAAIAISMIETQQVAATGEQVSWFTPAPKAVIREDERTGHLHGAINHWQAAMKAMDDLIAEAKIRPEAAKALFSLLLLGSRDTSSVREAKALLQELEIPVKFMSHLSTPYRSRDIVRMTG